MEEDRDTIPIDRETDDSSGDQKVGLLQIIRGENIGGEFVIEAGSNIVGRQKSCSIQILDKSISRRHAQIVCNPDEPPDSRYTIYDLQSTTGVRINNETKLSYVLRDSDRVQFGNVVCKFMIVDTLERNFLQEIKKLIEYDDRTKLLQIRPFYDRLEKALEASDAKHSAVSVMMMDLDGLKQINDTHGHLMGTDVIVRIADLINEEFSPSGIAAIYGGDEFAAYLEDTTRAEATERAERLRTLVSEVRFADKGIAERVTISIGIASYPGDGTEMMQLLANADRALFFAKAQGKNRVVVFDPDTMETPG
jgi:diguanylate cyclase (GGDEF)-like protein